MNPIQYQMKSINYCLDKLEKMGVEFENKDNFHNFLVDYACQSLESNGESKNEHNMKYLITLKWNNLYVLTEHFKKSEKYHIMNILTPKDELIEKIIGFEKKTGLDGLMVSIHEEGDNLGWSPQEIMKRMRPIAT